jgi:hypothetical protein
MSKQVKTPRFYVDIPTFLHATGQIGWAVSENKGGGRLLYMNPSNPFTMDTEVGMVTPFEIGSVNHNPPKTAFPINFCALLNHNLASNENAFIIFAKHQLSVGNPLESEILGEIDNMAGEDHILNSNNNGQGMTPEWNGTTIFKFPQMTEYWRSFEIYYDNGQPIDAARHQLGSLVVGRYWEPPNSPDLNLTMSRRFDGIKKQKTIGGKTLANIYYDGPTEWTMYHRDDGTYKYPPFELDFSYSLDLDLPGSNVFHSWRAKSGVGRKGLRSWKLTFSYISDDDMWMAYESSSIAPFADGDSGLHATTNTDIPEDNGAPISSLRKPNPMLSDDSFNFVWNATLGGTLPFLFQPDNTNHNTDQFSICRFRENTLNVQQVANNVYTLSITIDEVA